MDRHGGTALDGDPAWLAVPGPVGELDLASLPVLHEVLRDVVGQRPPGVILDFSAVTFMDCSALGPLLEARARLGGRLRLAGVDRRVRKVLEATYLYEVLVAAEGAHSRSRLVAPTEGD